MSNRLPDGLTVERNAELKGRTSQVWIRRALLCAIALFPVLGLLNVFGQEPTGSVSRAQAAILKVSAPSAIRGGLEFQARAEVTARHTIVKPRLVFGRGWWESTGVNSIEPEPISQETQNGSVGLSFDKLRAGHTLIVWINFTANADNAGLRSEDVALDDGAKPITRIHRSLTIYP
jgi:hypothetical protein